MPRKIKKLTIETNKKAIPLSNTELEAYCKAYGINNIEFKRYSSLHTYSNLEQLFTDGICILFIDNLQNEIGHWTLLIKHSDSCFEFFDSYGNESPDKSYEMLNGDNPKVFVDLLIKSKINDSEYMWNDRPLQAFDTNYCGKYVIARICSRSTNLCEWVEILTHNTKFEPDQIIDKMFRIKLLR